MQVGLRFVAQPGDIGRRFVVVLAAADEGLHLGIPSLNADFELQSLRREFFE